VLLDLPPAERAPWLDALRAEDAQAAESLAALLAQADSTGVGRFLDGQALHPRWPASGSAPTRSRRRSAKVVAAPSGERAATTGATAAKLR